MDRFNRMHGSGTPIGDALELLGLKEAFTATGSIGSTTVVGSNKGNIGNTQVSQNTSPKILQVLPHAL